MERKHKVSDYETAQNRRNLVVGIFVVVGILAFGWLIFKFGDLPSWMARFTSYPVYVQFQSAPGVQQGTPVRFCGYQIGQVTAVDAPDIRPEIVHQPDVTPRWYHQTKVKLSINNDFNNIPNNCEVKLMTRGLGSSYIELRAPIPDANTVFLTAGMSLQGSTGISSEFFPEETQEKLEGLVEDLRLFVGNANDIVGNAQNKQNLKQFLTNLTKVSEQAGVTLKEASLAIEDYRQLASTGTKAIEHADSRLQEVVAAVVTTADHLSEASTQLNLLLMNVNQGDGTLGKFVNDGRLYEELLESTDQLQILMTEMRALLKAVNERGLGRVWKKGTQ